MRKHARPLCAVKTVCSFSFEHKPDVAAYQTHTAQNAAHVRRPPSAVRPSFMRNSRRLGGGCWWRDERALRLRALLSMFVRVVCCERAHKMCTHDARRRRAPRLTRAGYAIQRRRGVSVSQKNAALRVSSDETALNCCVQCTNIAVVRRRESVLCRDDSECAWHTHSIVSFLNVNAPRRVCIACAVYIMHTFASCVHYA